MTPPVPHSARRAEPRRTPRAVRRGGIYVLVLGCSMLVTVIGLAAITAARLYRATQRATECSAKARLYAESAIELALLNIGTDPAWRTSNPDGTWSVGGPIGDGTCSVAVTDPLDGSISNRPTDAVLITGTGVCGPATQITTVRLAAQPTAAIDALKCAVHTGGQLHVRSGRTLSASGALVSANGTLRNDGTIDGSVDCLLATAAGTVTGSLRQAVLPKPMPDSGVVAMYAALGTSASTSSGTVSDMGLSPAVNPLGALDPDGVYVMSGSGDLTLRRCAVIGTLVVLLPAGKQLTIDLGVFMRPSRADYPSLIVRGDLVLQFDPTLVLAMNLDGEVGNENYPSEIRGLVHCTGTLTMKSASKVNGGAIIAESSTLSDAADFDNTPTIVFDPALFTSPPMGYAKSVKMTPIAGTWAQAVRP
jgi:hypothetical protein